MNGKPGVYFLNFILFFLLFIHNSSLITQHYILTFAIRSTASARRSFGEVTVIRI